MAEPSQGFYVGKEIDLATSAVAAPDRPVFYKPADLTTHAVVVGMTGSGKTGLLVSLLEEAALQKLPAIIIDPKGDLTNLLLHFPELRAEDFEPWVDPEEARRQGIAPVELAAKTAENWAKGLAGSGLGTQQLQALSEAVDYRVYSPGSNAAEPVNLLSSFACPAGSWEEQSESLRERIASTTTALLGLVGMHDVDPLRSREHILLSNIFENAWKNGKSIDLTEIIMQVQTPPFTRLGAFAVDQFFPAKDRMELAMLLNNILASPSFQTWMSGPAMDAQGFLYTAEGKPRFSIFYLAHLSDDERMFFVTLLLAAVESWMRAQRGTGALRALLAFDELVGYMPPVANPPSRPVLLRLLKQARAFGLGLVLSTQNPVDLDYKALSNAGTWFVGRLQANQDKQRLLDGLESLQGGVERGEMDRMISGLQKRWFVLHNVNQAGHKVLTTRWAMNYLAGPLTRVQLPGLRKLQAPAEPAATPATPPKAEAGSTQPVRVQPAAPVAAAAPEPAENNARATATPPAAPEGFPVYYLKPRKAARTGEARLVYQAALFGQCDVRFAERALSLEETERFTALAQDLRAGKLEWALGGLKPVDAKQLPDQPPAKATFEALPDWMAKVKTLAAAQRELVDLVFREAELEVRANETLKLAASAEMGEAEFARLCQAAAEKAADAELDKLEKAFKARIDTLEDKVERQERDVDKQEDKVSSRRTEEGLNVAETLFGKLLGGSRKGLTGVASRRRMTREAEADLKDAKEELNDLRETLEDLTKERDEAAEEIRERWTQAALAVAATRLKPLKKDVYVEVLGVLWLPYYQYDGGAVEAAFES